MDYRHELKFLVTDAQLSLIEFGLKPLMKQDVHQDGKAYTIRSLYFDDFHDSCMRENEDGIDNRKKYRIRIYNGESSVIKLEKKMKYRGMTKKVGAVLSIEECRTYMVGQTPALTAADADLKKELYAQIKGNGMHPVCIVEYERCAFVEPVGNVRVTFDRNISGCDRCTDFLDKEIPLIPLLPKGQHVLEVKYDELLPEYIAEVLNLGVLQRTSFSKYYYARNYKNI